MDRSFIIPIAVAAGVHSMLFLSGNPIKVTPPPAGDALDPKRWTVVDVPPLDPDPIVSDETAERAPTAPPPPVSIGLPSPTVSRDDITQVFDPIEMLPRPQGPVAETIGSDWTEAVTAAGTKLKGLSYIELDNKPGARFQPAPAYPHDLRALGSDGSATVTFLVDVHGNVVDASVSRATHSSFGDEALRAVRRWRFDPGIKNGKRVSFRMVQTFTFSLSQ